MSTKLKLVSKLEGTFPVVIEVSDLNGTEFSITFDGIARTQKTWAKERDAMIAEASAKIKAAEEKPKKKAKAGEVEEVAEIDADAFLKYVTERMTSEAKLTFKMASGWSLDEAFNIENMEVLEDRFPGSVAQLHDKYNAAIFGNRRKN